MSWPLVEIGSVADVNPRLPKDIDESQDISFVGMASVSEDGKLLTEEVRTLSEVKKGFTNFSVSDVLLAKITPCFENGKCLRANKISHDIGFGSTEFHVLRPNRKELDAQYLFYIIWNEQFRFYGKHSMSGAAGQKRVSADFIRGYKIPLPPLKEQQRIAAVLDKADAIRHKRQQAIQLADEFLRSVFLDMFGDPVMNPKGWEMRALLRGVESISSGWSAKGEGRPCRDGEVGVLKISAVTSGVFRSEENKVVDNTAIPSSKKLIFPARGDLLFSRANTRELVAATCIVSEDRSDVFLPDKLWLIKTNDNQILPEFLHQLIWHPRFKEKLTSQATGTSGSMLNISKSKFESTLAIFPPIKLQEKFAKIYAKTQKTLEMSQELSGAGESLFGSLSQKAFTGDL